MRQTLESRQALKAYYERYWENPIDPRNLIFDALNEHVRGRIPPGHGRVALDVGCGKGRITRMLLERGYRVTALDVNERFVDAISRAFPGVRAYRADISEDPLDDDYDLITCIEVAQNLPLLRLISALTNMTYHCERLFISISNLNSAHTRYIALRGWIAPFVHLYAPWEIELLLRWAGFRITHRRGFGLLTPVTLLRGFRGPVVPRWMARTVNRLLDPYFPECCHLYYVEGEMNER